MDKHCFGSPVTCAWCGQPVSAVLAASRDEASNGRGYCEDCLEKAAAAAPSVEVAPSFVSKLTAAPDEETDAAQQ